jgi:uncharacterized protein
VKPIALLLACVVAGGPAVAAESEVQAGPGVAALWRTPDAGWDGRAVLLLHGFADDRDGVGDLAKTLSAALEARGIASLRINFRGEGDRNRTQIGSTFTTRLEDAAAATRFLQARPGVDRARLGALGFSLGASTAIVTAGREPAWFRTLAVWSSPGGDHFALYADDPVAKRAMADGEATEDVPGWKKITTRREFYESFRGIDVDASLARYPGAFLSVRGTDDFLPQHEVEFLKVAKGMPREAVLIGGGDHTFRVLEAGATHPARVVSLTVDWFGRTL